MRFVESPARKGVQYSPEMTLQGEAIDFGYLERPNLMVVKATKRDPDAIKLFLNLDRLEIEVHFAVLMKSKGKTTARDYRFFVALDDQFSMCEISQESTTSLVFHLKNAPWYSRQLKEAMQMSHDPKSRRWTADDTWSRQTDIVDDKETYTLIDNSPVSIRKFHNSIDMARWTTFRVTINTPSPDASTSPVRQFVKALQDFNVPVTQNPSFQVVTSSPKEAPLWSLIDDLHSRSSSLTEQLSAIYLPFELRYQLEVCISQGWLNEYTINKAFLERLTAMPLQRAKQMLIHVDTYQQRVYDPMEIFEDLRYSKPVRSRLLPANCNEIYHATVTATGILFHSPSIELTNRIIRKYQRYSDRFLRVRFEDDSYRGRTKLYPATNGRMRLIFDRVRRTLTQGIVIGDRHYEFLAWGNSQLREHGAYFFATTHDPYISPDTIRKAMGVFDREKVVAKRAARMGQCFSTTKAVSAISRRTFNKDAITDITNGPYNFTDGVGKISPLTAELVRVSLKHKGLVPSAFQFRLGGCKGVLVVDPTLYGVDIKIRPSQYKFECDSEELEIIRVSEFWQPFLNRQLILVLSDLGVPDNIFLQKQEECIKSLDRAMVDDTAALRALRENVDPNLATLSIAALIEDGFRQSNEIFTTSLLRLYRAWTLKYLKEKAKIPVPQGAFVLGVVDEYGTLSGYKQDLKPAENATQQEREACLPEIFLQYTVQHTGKSRILEGVCIVARNPSLHRGDIRVAKAVDRLELRHLRDVVVMPSVGDRDLPSMCSGGDLDGDDYVVIWDPDLIPPEWHAEPFSYEAPEPVTKAEITTRDIINFFCDYMQNDFLGRIAHAHLAAADYLDDGIRSKPCLELVNLHSKAVDYPKTGVPADMPRDLERNKWPHFMEKKKSPQYKSHKILGQLYDAVERVAFEPNWEGTFDQRILTQPPPSDQVMDEVRVLKKSYDEGMRRIMAQHQIKTEFEVWSTFVLHHSKAARDFKFHEEIGQHAKTLKEQYYEVLVQLAGGREFGNLMPVAVAAYHITYDEVRQAQEKMYHSSDTDLLSDSDCSDHSGSSESVELPFISFPWVLQDVLGKIARSTVFGRGQNGRAPVEATNTTLSRHSDDINTALDMHDKGDGSGHFMYLGEHLSDPYIPDTANIDGESAKQDEALDGQIKEHTQSTVEDLLSFSPRGVSTTSKQPSLFLPFRPAKATELKLSGDQSASENSSIASGINSMFSSTATGSASVTPDDVYPPQSVLSRAKGYSAESAKSSSSASGHAIMEFDDPADDVNGGIVEDDDDDFTY